MADKDGEFMGEHGDEFSPSQDDEFEIPDNAYSEDDENISEHADEFGDNFADDLSGLDESDDLTEELTDEDLRISDEPLLDRDQEVRGTSGRSQSDDNESNDDYQDQGQTKQGLGWKAWTGLALAGLITAGGLTYFVMPDTQSPAQQRSGQSFPQPPQQPPQASSNNVQAPVNVQAFPNSAQQQSGSQGSGYAANSQQGGGSGSGNNGGVMPPRGNNQFDQPAYIQEIEDQLAEFSSINRLAQRNASRINDTEESLANFRGATETELSMINKRLEALEDGESRPARSDAAEQSDTANADSDSGNKQEQAEKTTESKSEPEKATAAKSSESKAKESGDNDGFVYRIPRSPEQISQLQQTLKENGYRPGAIDGILGGQTREAIKRLQKEHGLPITGWLSAETMMAVENPNTFSGSYAAQKREPSKPRTKKTVNDWFVRGMTRSKAVVYRMDGMSYAVSVGTEIPGMGEVIAINPGKHRIETAHGIISRR